MSRDRVADYLIEREIQDGDRRMWRASRGYGRDRYLLARLDLEDELALQLEEQLLRTMEIGHRNVLRPVEIFADRGEQVVVYEELAGTTLTRLCRYLDDNADLLDDGAALEIGRQLARGLAAAHAAIDSASGERAPLVHGDLGPHQIFIGWQGEVKVLGLGLGPAFRRAAKLRATTDAAAAFAAPEVRRGAVPTVRANVYSAALLLWSLLTHARPPTDGSRPEPLRVLCRDLNAELASCVDRALACDPRERTLTCAELADAIEETYLSRPDELRWSMEIFRALADFDDTMLEVLCLPPASLREGRSTPACPLATSSADPGEISETRARAGGPRDDDDPSERTITEPLMRSPSRAALTDADITPTPLSLRTGGWQAEPRPTLRLGTQRPARPRRTGGAR